MKLKLSIGLLLALAPAFASARPKQPTVHVRSQAFHDHTPKARIHESLPHRA